LKIISGKHFSGDLRKPVGKKTPVIADHNFVFRFPLFRFPLSNNPPPACATRATLANVKSSAMTARQPSVPNLMSATRKSWQKNSRVPSVRD